MVIQEKKVAIFTRYRIKEGNDEDFEKNLIEMAKPVRERKECVSYEVYRSETDKKLFYTMEKWETIGGLNKDREFDHLIKFKKKYRTLMENEPETALLKLIV